MGFKLPESFKQRQKEIYDLKYITVGDKEIHVSELEDKSVTTEMKSQMRMNSYAQDDLPPKLTDDALLNTINHYMNNCSQPNYPCSTYDEALIHRLLPELVKRFKDR